MNVYAESNFVLEHALQQEESDSCGEIIRLASASKITLVVPAFSLAEPYQAISLGRSWHGFCPTRTHNLLTPLAIQSVTYHA